MYSAERLNNVKFSEVRVILAKAREMEKQGQKIIHLEIGEPDFPTPSHIVDAAHNALDGGMTHYSSNRGSLNLREAISRKLAEENGISRDPEKEILVTVGAAEAIFDSMVAFLNPGDEVIILNPCYFNYLHIANMVGAKPVMVPLAKDNDFQVDPDVLKAAVTPKTKMIVINTPNNPTGTLLGMESLKAIADVAIENNLLVVSDEIYEKITYENAIHHSIASLPGMEDRAITINGFSKAYAMTGWRLGYVAAAEHLISSILKVHQYATTCVSTFVQEAAVAAYNGPADAVKAMVNEFDKRRRFLIQAFENMEGVTCTVPKGAFYVFPDISRFGMSSKEFCDMVLNKAGVAIVPGHAFGPAGEGCVRISYATSLDLIKEGIERISNVLPKLG